MEAGRRADSVASIRKATSPADYEIFAGLVREYVASLPFVLDFQDLEHELANLSTGYGSPGGCALLAAIDDTTVGCAAVTEFEAPSIAELKRMYLRPEARGRGLGKALCVAALEAAEALGYELIRLDTVAELASAARVYEALGFYEIAPYRYNPLPTARFYETKLGAKGSQ